MCSKGLGHTQGRGQATDPIDSMLRCVAESQNFKIHLRSFDSGPEPKLRGKAGLKLAQSESHLRPILVLTLREDNQAIMQLS